MLADPVADELEDLLPLAGQCLRHGPVPPLPGVSASLAGSNTSSPPPYSGRRTKANTCSCPGPSHPPVILGTMRTRTAAESRSETLDTNRCSWSDASHDEHTFADRAFRGGPMTAATAAARTGSRPPTEGPSDIPAAAPRYGSLPAGGQPPPPRRRSHESHRRRPIHSGCQDPRVVAARAAALRRRHILLGVIAVGIAPGPGRSVGGAEQFGPGFARFHLGPVSPHDVCRRAGRHAVVHRRAARPPGGPPTDHDALSS